jgi:hypothetical protein
LSVGAWLMQQARGVEGCGSTRELFPLPPGSAACEAGKGSQAVGRVLRDAFQM